MEQPVLSARRVAVLSDVHANVVALRAVLAELPATDPDLVVFNGDLTWGSLPAETIELVRSLGDRVRFVRGNAERAVLQTAQRLRTGTGPPAEPGPEAVPARDSWMVRAHGPDGVAFVAGSVASLVVDVDGLGPVRFCHGSPRSDEECVTPATPAQRVTAFMAGVPERILVSGHTHLQYDRRVAGVRIVNPGSVGLPYHDGQPGAYWAVLGPDVDLRRTAYDIEEAIRRFRATDDPRVDAIAEMMRTAPTTAEVIADAETRVFAG